MVGTYTIVNYCNCNKEFKNYAFKFILPKNEIQNDDYEKLMI